MSQNHIARLLERSGKGGILVAGCLDFTNLLQNRRRTTRRNLRPQFLQGFHRRVALGRGEGGVEGHHTSACQPLNQPGIRPAGQREGTQLLQSPLVNPYNDDAIVMRAGATQGETQIQSTQFDVLQKEESGAAIAPDPGVSEENQASEGHQHGQSEVYLAGRDPTQPRRPFPFGAIISGE